MPIDAFLMFDFNNKGEIEQRQFMEIVKALGVSSKGDHDKTCRLRMSDQLVQPALQVKDDAQKLEEIFKATDEDGSGNIDYKEFKNIFVKIVDVYEELSKR